MLDTSLLVAAERGRFRLEDFFAACAGESFHLAAISASELLHGVERASGTPHHARRLAWVEYWLARLPVEDFDLAVARHHAVLWATLDAQGRMIGPHDLQIAATALRHELSVATLNTAEFARVPGLSLVSTSHFAR